MERLLTENTTTGKYEILQSTNGSLNTTSPGGGSSSTVIQGRTDIIDENTSTFLKCSSTGLLNISDEKITRGEGDITGGGDGLQQVLMYGKDQSGNLDPINVDSNGHLKITLNDIEPNITSAIKTEIFGLDGSTQRQISVDPSGRLITNTIYLIQRGNITFPAPFTSGGVSSSVDVSQKTTLDFHIEGMTISHTGFIVQGSNDNTNFYPLQMFTPQTVGVSTFIGGSITRGFRYYRIENAGSSVSITASPFNSYNV